MRLAHDLVATSLELQRSVLAHARDRIDPGWIEEAIARGGAVEVRRRKLPLDVVVWLIIGVNLIAGMGFTEVMQRLGLTARTRRDSVQAPPGSSAVVEARRRLGAATMRELFLIAGARWLDLEDFAHLRFHGLQVLAVDGFSVRTPDTASNLAEFGKPTSNKGSPAAYPLMNAVALMDAVTHVMCDVEQGPYAAGELTLFERLVQRIPERSITILDRNFDSLRHLAMFASAQGERHWLVRGKARQKVKIVRELGEGDALVEIAVDKAARRRNRALPAVFLARRIQYLAKGVFITVLTSLQDAERFPAAELAALYHRRWEIEMALDDIKTELRDRALTLRSKTPDLVKQEFYGLLLAHNLVRVEMARVAVLLRVPPTRISFHRALSIVADHLRVTAAATPPSKWADRHVLLRSELKFLLLPERRTGRAFPRVMKMPIGRYARKHTAAP